MLNWDEWLPALMLAYNTSYHSMISTTPFELVFGVKPRLPSLLAPDIERHHYRESFAAERLQLLQQQSAKLRVRNTKQILMLRQRSINLKLGRECGSVRPRQLAKMPNCHQTGSSLMKLLTLTTIMQN
jgi:hypothetical protein